MRYWLTRISLSLICLGLGIFIWQFKNQKTHAESGPAGRAQVNSPETAPAQPSQAAPPQQDAVISAVRFVPASPAHGMVRVKMLVLRENAAANSRVVANVKMDSSYYLDILDSTPDALKVSLHLTSSDAGNPGDKNERVYTGWTDWASVTPNESMIVLDAGTGAIITRRPLGLMWSPVAYSPDGTQAIFNGPSTNYTKCQVRTSDYSISRCINPNDASTFFYGPADGALYAAIQTIGGRGPADTAMHLHLVRINDEGASGIAAQVPDDAADFAISPDSLTGFYLHHEDSATGTLKVDVVDLATFKIRNSFTLHGENLPANREAFAVNQDGTELYATLEGGVGKVSVIDTRTGEMTRVLKFSHAPRESWYLSRGDVIGDSLLLGIGRGGHDEPHPTFRRIWLRRDGRVAIEKRFDMVTQSGGMRYALDTRSRRLFKLDSDNNLSGGFRIDLSSLRKGSADDLSIYTMSASPDGKSIILFVGPKPDNAS